MPTTSKHIWPLDHRELEPALRIIIAVAHADMGVLLLRDDADGRLMPVLAQGMTQEECDLFGAHHPTEGAFGVAVAEHRLVRVRNAWDDPTALHDVARRLGFRHLELLPFFRHDGSALGLFAIIYRKSNGHSRRRAARIAGDCAALFAVALSRARDERLAEAARAAIASAAQARVQFFARMSHELRTPLQSISGYIDLLRAGAAEPLALDQERIIARIAASEQILVHLIDDLLTFSRLETGHMPYDIGSISANDALWGAEGVLLPIALEHNVALRVSVDDDDVLVRADGHKLQQILVNLAANALKYTRAGGTVTLSRRRDGDAVTFDVADTGTGIPADKLSSIFEPYVQLEGAEASGVPGWGLGLAICRELSDGMKGTLSVRSEVGRGSVFTLRMPQAPLTATNGAAGNGAVANVAAHA